MSVDTVNFERIYPVARLQEEPSAIDLADFSDSNIVDVNVGFAELLSDRDIQTDFSKFEDGSKTFAELFAQIESQPSHLHEVTPVRTPPSEQHLPRHFAIGAATATLAITALVSVAAVLNPSENRPSVAEEAAEKTEEPQAEISDTSEAPGITTGPTTTSETPTSDSNEALAPSSLEVGHGDPLGTFHVPVLCEDIEVYGFSEREKAEGLIGTGAAVIDQLRPDPTPTDNCATLDQREAEHEATKGPFITRQERGIDEFQPIAGYELAEDGYITVLPGQVGNALIAGHGSTKSGPFTNIGLMRPGDDVVFYSAEGQVLFYKVIGSEILSPDNIEPFIDYSHPDYESTVTWYHCSDENGNTGSAQDRFVLRLGLV